MQVRDERLGSVADADIGSKKIWSQNEQRITTTLASVRSTGP